MKMSDLSGQHPSLDTAQTLVPGVAIPVAPALERLCLGLGNFDNWVILMLLSNSVI